MKKRRSGLNIFQPKPSSDKLVGNHVLDVNRMSHDGRGIAQLNNKVAFVAGALAGEKVKAKLVNAKAKFSELAVVEVIEASAERVEPSCEYFAQCGGCSLQHWSYSQQLAHKHTMLGQRLEKLARLDSVQHPPISSNPLAYRHRGRLSVDYKDGDVLLGFKAKASNNIVDISHCEVLVPQLSNFIKPLLALLKDCKGRFTEVSLMLVSDESGAEVVLIGFVSKIKLSKADVIRLTKFSEQHSAGVYLKPQIGEFEQLGDSQSYYLNNTKHGFKTLVQAGDFTQVNPAVNEQIVDVVIDYLAPTENDVIADLFSGLGNFTLPLSPLCKSVVGVEINQAMVSRLEKSAKLNNCDNVEGICADIYEDSTSYLPKQANKVLLDPPRAGAQAVCKALAKNKNIETIVYVSCDPATLARDLEVLCKARFKIKQYLAADMFAHTAHCEAVVHLAR